MAVVAVKKTAAAMAAGKQIAKNAKEAEKEETIVRNVVRGGSGGGACQWAQKSAKAANTAIANGRFVPQMLQMLLLLQLQQANFVTFTTFGSGA